MFFHHVQEVDDPASDGDSDHTDSEGSMDSKNTCECELSFSSLSETEKVYVAIDANKQCSVAKLFVLCGLHVYSVCRTSDSGPSEIGTQYDRPLYKGHCSRHYSQYI